MDKNTELEVSNLKISIILGNEIEVKAELDTKAEFLKNIGVSEGVILEYTKSVQKFSKEISQAMTRKMQDIDNTISKILGGNHGN